MTDSGSQEAIDYCSDANESINVTIPPPDPGIGPSFEQRVMFGVTRVRSSRYRGAGLYSVSARPNEGVIRPSEGNHFKAFQLDFIYQNKIVQINSDDESMIHSWKEPVEIDARPPAKLAPFAMSDMQVTVIEAINAIMAAGFTNPWFWLQIQFPSPPYQTDVLQRFISLAQTSGYPTAVVMADVTKRIFPVYGGEDSTFVMSCPLQKGGVTSFR